MTMYDVNSKPPAATGTPASDEPSQEAVRFYHLIRSIVDPLIEQRVTIDQRIVNLIDMRVRSYIPRLINEVRDALAPEIAELAPAVGKLMGEKLDGLFEKIRGELREGDEWKLGLDDDEGD